MHYDRFYGVYESEWSYRAWCITNSNDDVERADNIDGDSPEVHEATHVHQGESHTEEDKDGARQVGKKQQGRNEDAGQGYAQVTGQLRGYHLDKESHETNLYRHLIQRLMLLNHDLVFVL